MPLRKKHVRYAVFTLVMVGVLGLLAGLLIYGLHVRSGAYGRAIETALASRLRCEAALGGARPTGLATAAAETVHLAWTAAGGRLTLDLQDVEAHRNPDGSSWTVTAATGRLALAGPEPAATLSAINQRLVQVEADVPVNSLYVQRLALALALAPLRVEAETRLVLFPGSQGLEAHLFDSGPTGSERTVMDRPALEPDAEAYRPLARMRLDPTGERGVFAGLHADLKQVPTDAVRRALGIGRPSRHTAGAAPNGIRTARVTVNWFWPDADAEAATVTVEVHDLDLSAWTAEVPGGAIEGTGAVQVLFARREGRTHMLISVDVKDGSVRGETLDWLDALPAPLAGWGDVRSERVPFDRLSVEVRASDGTACFAGPHERDLIPLMTVRLLGHEVPLLWASTEAFDGAALWRAVHQGLEGGENGPSTQRGSSRPGKPAGPHAL